MAIAVWAFVTIGGRATRACYHPNHARTRYDWQSPQNFTLIACYQFSICVVWAIFVSRLATNVFQDQAGFF